MAYATTTQLAAETSARKAADATEATARQNADANLSSQIAALASRVAALENLPPVVPPVVPPTPPSGTSKTVSSIAALLAAINDSMLDEIVLANGVYDSPSAETGAGLCFDQRYARTRPLIIRAETDLGAVIDGGGRNNWNPLIFRDAPYLAWGGLTLRGLLFAHGTVTQTGLIVFGQNGSVTPGPATGITLQHMKADATVLSGSTQLSGDHFVYFSSSTAPCTDIALEDFELDAAAANGLDSFLHFYVQPALGVGPRRVRVQRFNVKGTDTAILLWDASLVDVAISDGVIANARRFAVRYEIAAQSVALTRCTSTGSGSKGFYSPLPSPPPGLTLAGCSFA